MADNTSIFGAKPERLDRLVFEALDQPEEGKQASPKASLSMLIEQSGGWIGRYKLLSVLGEGGMGIVYLAEQKQPIKRQVALKVIKPGMDSKRVIARFEAERQALALLDHPNIAHVYDAGTTEAGRPYFVMEYVEGMPITEHCDHHKLTIDDRLKLFLQVCHAIHHAHQKGIIHRDIKPSNILVSTQVDQAIPKIIDFGVAKALSKPLTERTLITEQGQLFGTPEYMSPEQVDMANEDIDTRSDIYSLGVLLYVLLTGVLPFDSTTLRESGIEHIRKVIRETDPKTPSTRLTKLGEEAKKVAESRRTEVATLARCLHRELEWIPLKAMRKERSERYRSASEFADDIENYLKVNPLIAGPPSTTYRLKKFVRRHKAFVTGIAAVLVVVVAGIMVSTLFAIKSERARAEAQAVSDFLRSSVLASLNPRWVGGREITIRSVLDAASESLERGFKGTLLAEAEIRQTLGSAYWSIGLYEQAELHFKSALEINQAQLGAEDPATIVCMRDLGWVYYSQSHYDESELLLTKAVQGSQLVFDEGHGARLYSMGMLAMVYYMQGRFNEGNQLYIKVLETVRRVLGEEHEFSPSFMGSLGWGYIWQGRYNDAERLLNRGLEISRISRGEQDWETLMVTHGLGWLYWELGRYDEAEQLLVNVLDHRSKILGEEHPEMLITMASLGLLYHSQGRYEEAEDLLSKTLETARRVLGDEHLYSLSSMAGLGTLYLSQGRYDESEPLLVKALEIERRVMGEENWTTLDAISTLAKLYVAQRRYTEAEDMYLKTLEAQDRVLGEKHLHTLRSMNGLAQLYTQQAQYQKAESLFTKVLEIGRSVVGATHPQILASMHNLAMLYEVQGLYDKAEPVLLQALEGRRLKLGDTHPHTLESLNNLIDLYKAWNKPKKAEEWQTKLPQTEITEE